MQWVNDYNSAVRRQAVVVNPAVPPVYLPKEEQIALQQRVEAYMRNEMSLSPPPAAEPLQSKSTGPTALAQMTTTESPVPSLAGELERLARLHSQGALSDEEFDLSKKTLLGPRPSEALTPKPQIEVPLPAAVKQEPQLPLNPPDTGVCRCGSSMGGGRILSKLCPIHSGT